MASWSPELASLNEKAKLYPAVCDFAKKEGVDEFIKILDEQIKAPVDVLVNNLGIFEAKKFEDISDDEWFHFFNVNVDTLLPWHPTLCKPARLISPSLDRSCLVSG